jgi:K+-transporting ATPase A subunit
MKPNMGSVDRAVRALVAVAIGALYFSGTVSGTVAVVLAVVAVVFLATSAVGTCPAYIPLGLSTRKKGGAE